LKFELVYDSILEGYNVISLRFLLQLIAIFIILSKEMVADPLTKTIVAEIFKGHVHIMGIIE
jgi:hypothetical protein